MSVSPPAAERRAAVIGLGRMGQRHLEALEKIGMKIVGVSDVAAAARETARTRFNLSGESCFAEGTELLAAIKPDTLVIATTAPAHASLTIAAAEAGVKNILCEKPMAVSLAEADAMIAACQRTGATLAINHQMQFLGQYTQVKPLIGSAALGPLVSIVVAAGNFGLAMNACHYFEMFRYIAGCPVTTIQAWFDDAQLANPRGAQFEDRAGRLLARSAGGPTMYLDFAAEAGNGIHVTYICRLGQIVVDEINGFMRVLARKAEHRDLPTARYGMPSDIEMTEIHGIDVVTSTADLWSAMLGGRPYPDGEAGRHALACCVAAHVSHEAGGREIAINDPALPRERLFKWA